MIFLCGCIGAGCVEWLSFCRAARLILESVKKLEKLFIAPKARQILHETAHRALARCECAQHMGFLMKYFNQESVSEPHNDIFGALELHCPTLAGVGQMFYASSAAV